MRAQRFYATDRSLDSLYGELADWSLQPLWELTNPLTPEPRPRSTTYRWPGDVLRNLGAAVGDLVPFDTVRDRRVLVCCNPGFDGAPHTVSTLLAAVQFLNGGESAPPHRHTPAALRFVVEGHGVWTAVDGDPVHMESGDLILTPSWTFHEHHNPGTEAMIWLDVLDLPLVAALDAVFFEEGHAKTVNTQTDQRSTSEKWFGGGPGLVPAGGSPLTAHRSPLLAYRWADTDRALKAQLDVASIGHARIRYADPTSGGDVMPTMRCEMQRILAGHVTGAERQTGGRIACVLHGAGQIRVGDGTFDLGTGDVIAIPSWQPWSISADTELDIFSTSDAPILEAVGLYRHETTTENRELLDSLARNRLHPSAQTMTR
jgi:gentisate 1,2-dioxygenase